RCADVLLPRLRVRQIQPAGKRAVRRRLEVGGAAERRVDEEAALRARVRSGHWLRPALRIESGVPVLIHEWRSRQERAVGPIENVEMSVAIGVHQQLALLSVPDAI